jgi:putative AlgH/UPF0301 family transcriptional regulator
MIPKRFGRGSSRLYRLLGIAAAVALLQAPAQSTRVKDLGAGKVLVASRELHDPNFAETVVLLVHYDEDSVLGLIVDRQTKVPLSRVFQDLKGAKGRSDPVYAGGPVERTVAMALLRSRTKHEEADHVFADIELISSKGLLEKTLATGIDSDKLRVYLGYSGWTTSQLQAEVELGAWHIFPGDAGMVFDPDPESLWSRLIRKTEQRIASSDQNVASNIRLLH